MFHVLCVCACVRACVGAVRWCVRKLYTCRQKYNVPCKHLRLQVHVSTCGSSLLSYTTNHLSSSSLYVDSFSQGRIHEGRLSVWFTLASHVTAYCFTKPPTSCGEEWTITTHTIYTCMCIWVHTLVLYNYIYTRSLGSALLPVICWCSAAITMDVQN